MARLPKAELVPVVQGFDYSPLEPRLAEQVREKAARNLPKNFTAR